MDIRMPNIATPMPQIRAKFTSKLGIPLSGCKAYTYEPNSNIPKTTWIDIDKTVENTNPILLDAAGEADIFLDGLYQIVVKDRFGFTVYDVEKIGYEQPIFNDGLLLTWSGRTQESKNRDFVSDKDYGAIGDGTYHPLSEKYATLALAKFSYANIAAKITSLTQSIDWAAAQSAIQANKQVWIHGGYRIITDTIEIPVGSGFIGVEKPSGNAEGVFLSGAAFLFYGTGAKTNIAPTLGDEVYQTANPSTGAAYLADSGTRGNIYKLQNFNENFSAAVILNTGSYMDKVAVIPYFSVSGGNGLSGYLATESGACANKWDVGVWARNCGNWYLSHVWGRGQWRKAGLLISASKLNDGVNLVANDGWYVENSVFAGGAGLSLRSDNAAQVGFTNYGFGNASFVNCQFLGFAHQSNHLATSSYLTDPLDRPSACIELNGIDNKPRGVDFTTCTLFGRDDISIFSGYASEIKFNLCYQEAKGLRIAGVWTANTEGSRMVVSADSNLQFSNHSKNGIDFAPNFKREPGVLRYGSDVGCFNVNSPSSDDDYEYYKYANSAGIRMRRGSGTWNIADKDLNALFTVDYLGNVTAKGSVYFKGSIESEALGIPVVIKRRNAAGIMETMMWFSGTNTGASLYGTLTPSEDNAFALGSSPNRWSTIYASTGAINTSDLNSKEQITGLSDAEKAVALSLKPLIKKFKFKDAVAAKGNEARWHIGVIAQEVISAFEAQGLNAFEYGIVCFDEWEATEEIEAGSRYAIRYDELSMFILSAT